MAPASKMSAGKQVRKAKGLSKLTVKKAMKKDAEKVPSQRGEGLKFALETYEAVSKFTGQTRIKYVPNPKNVGSKSYERYARYMKAKTVDEALKLGSKPADLLWEYQRGYLKVLGGPRSKISNCLKGDKVSKTGAERVLSSFRGPTGFSLKMKPEKRKLCLKVAKDFGYDLDKLHAEADETGNNESADIQTERTLADALSGRLLAEAAKARRKVSDADVTQALQIWGFARNESRQNVLPKGQSWVYSDTLGPIRLRNGKFRVTDPTLAYPNFTKLLCKWFSDNQPDDIACKCVFTGINVNANYAGRVHRDANNEGPSAIKALGKFTGGNLMYWPQDRQKPRPPVETMEKKESITLDLRRKFVLFDGNCAHGVEKFQGERFSLVFFTTKGYGKVSAEDCGKLQKLGFQLPTEKVLAAMKRAAKDAYA